MVDAPVERPESAPSKSVTNVFWAYVSFLATKVLNLVSIVILARYLTPAEFGVMAICLALMGYFEIVSQFGMGQALISARDRVERTASAVFVCGILISGAIAGALWLSSGWIAATYREPLLEDLLAVLALSLLIGALTTVHNSLLYKELQLRRKVVPDIVRGVTKGVVSIVLALLGFGVWSLLWGYLAGALAGGVALVAMRPWLPTVLPDLRSVRFVLGFGLNLIGAELINATPRLLDNLLIGRVLGAAPLGIYALAFRIPELGIKTFTNVAGSVLHPIMSLIQGDPQALRTYYYDALRYCALLMFGGGAAIVVLADPLVRVLYEPRWYGMILPMQLLAVALAIGTLNMVPGKVFKAMSRTDLLFRVALINLPVFVALIWLSVPYGIEAVAFAQIVLAIVRYVPTYVALKRIMDVSVRETLRALMPAVACALGAAAATLVALRLELPGEPARLALAAAVFAIAYLALVRLIAPEVLQVAGRMVLRRRRRRRRRRFA